MISAANFHSYFDRENFTGRFFYFNEFVVRERRVGHLADGLCA
ncbi:hypothetical protein BURPS1106B_1995 [Burkholderia pseudomallei 1106b]|uniref:Uncharacterized protein n=2 Tax=Burkholderia pseudomallei TaxID=28450 RepID=A0A0E1W321_BURPE|nr:hypothetical protein BURPS1106A_A3175 [Burkholderia pseudomallei 1106a]EES21879.1 hypothetical protein BURPS1106B_1995 [Burkholderia pseudomallei 1106b]EET04057.1 hypothetical protein BURPS1710A_A2477 [Burkholderia pseudomallei 1710a]VUD66593.1 unnamed protein product [Burkholderia pseudomallei]